MKTRALLSLAALLALPPQSIAAASAPTASADPAAPVTSATPAAPADAPAGDPAAADADTGDKFLPFNALVGHMPADASVIWGLQIENRLSFAFALRGDLSFITRDVPALVQLMAESDSGRAASGALPASDAQALSRQMPELYISVSCTDEERDNSRDGISSLIAEISLTPGARFISQGEWNGVNFDLVALYRNIAPPLAELASRQFGERRLSLIYRIGERSIDLRCGEDLETLTRAIPSDNALSPMQAELSELVQRASANRQAESEVIALGFSPEGLEALRLFVANIVSAAPEGELLPPALVAALGLLDEKSPASLYIETDDQGYRVRAKAALNGLHFSPGTLSGAEQADAAGTLAYVATSPVRITNPLLTAAAGPLPTLLEEGASALISEHEGQLSLSLSLGAKTPEALTQRLAALCRLLGVPAPADPGSPLSITPVPQLSLSAAPSAGRLLLKSAGAPDLAAGQEPVCGLRCRLNTDRLAAVGEQSTSALEALLPSPILDFLANECDSGRYELSLSEQNGRADISLSFRSEQGDDAAAVDPSSDIPLTELPPAKAKLISVSGSLLNSDGSKSREELTLKFEIASPMEGGKVIDRSISEPEIVKNVKTTVLGGTEKSIPVDWLLTGEDEKRGSVVLNFYYDEVPAGAMLKTEGSTVVTVAFDKQVCEPEDFTKSFSLNGVNFRVSRGRDELNVTVSARDALRIKELTLLSPNGEMYPSSGFATNGKVKYYFAAQPPYDDYRLIVVMYNKLGRMPVAFDTQVLLPAAIDDAEGDAAAPASEAPSGSSGAAVAP